MGLAGLAVEAVALTPLGIRVVQLVTADPNAARCPGCGQVSTSAKEWTLTRPRDLPVGGEPVLLQWRKRRWRCRTEACPRQSFTEQVPEVPARARTTTRMRMRLATAMEDGRGQAEVAATFGVSWPTVQRAVVAHARRALGEPAPTPVLGVDETRFGRPRWVCGPGGWSRTEPWETGFVDLAGGQGLLGQVDGRTTAAVRGWLAARSAEFRQRGVPGRGTGSGDRPARRLRPRGPRTAAAGGTRRRPLPPGPAGQQSGHRRAPAGHP